MYSMNYIRKITKILLLVFICAAVLFAVIPSDSYAASVKKPSKVIVTSVKSTDYNSLKVTWKKAKNAKKYQVYRATSFYGKYKLVKTTSYTYFNNKNLTTGKKYYFKVRGVNGSKKGLFSAKKSAVPTLKKVSRLKLSAAETTVKLTFDKVNGASGYQIYRAGSKSGSYTKVGSTTKLTYTNKSRKTNTTYYYKVRAYRKVNGGYKYGSYSSVKFITTDNHNYTEQIIAPTCKKEGYTLHKCTGCGEAYKDTFIKIKDHEFCVPVYMVNTDLRCCYACLRPSHVEDADTGNGDLVCIGNYGSAWLATIVSYRCMSCTDMIDVRDYEHTCDWQPVYSRKIILDKCKFCGDSGSSLFRDGEDRINGASVTVRGRNIHEGCYEMCEMEYGDCKAEHMYVDEEQQYISYWHCPQCSRIKYNSKPEIEMQVEGKKVMFPLILDKTAWQGLDGTEWIFPTLEEVNCDKESLAAFKPGLGEYMYKVVPGPGYNRIDMNEFSCQFCGETSEGTSIFDLDNHFCNIDEAIKEEELKTLPEAVSGVEIKGYTDSIVLSWDKIEGVEGYTVYRADSKDGEYIELGNVSQEHFTDMSAATGETSYYKIRAYILKNYTRAHGKASTPVGCSRDSIDEVRQELLTLINNERKKAGVPVLQIHEVVNATAQEKAEATYYENNTAGTFEEQLNNKGLEYTELKQFVTKKNVRAGYIYKTWANSSICKDVIIDSAFTNIGIGYCHGVWTVQFVGLK